MQEHLSVQASHQTLLSGKLFVNRSFQPDQYQIPILQTCLSKAKWSMTDTRGGHVIVAEILEEIL